MDKRTLVLDLDECLIYSNAEEDEYSSDFDISLDDRVYHVYKRPHLQTFLDYAFSNFNVIIWTASIREYAEKICNEIMRDREYKLLCREDCSVPKDFRDNHLVKDLSRLDIPLNSIIAVDDNKDCYELQPNNLYHIKPFYGYECKSTSGLLELIEFLKGCINNEELDCIYDRKLF